MTYKIEQWDGAARAEQDIQAAFESERLSPSRWSNGPGDRYSEHSHSYYKVLYCVRGSITFHIDGEDLELLPGDRLEIEPATRHAATVGKEGVTCMEAAREK